MQWVDNMKQGCQLCHQLGNKVTAGAEGERGAHRSGERDARGRPRGRGDGGGGGDRIRRRSRPGTGGSRPAGRGHEPVMSRSGCRRGLGDVCRLDDLDRGKGPPPPPAGVERNLVLTFWDVSHSTAPIHDEIATNMATRRSMRMGRSRDGLITVPPADGH